MICSRCKKRPAVVFITKMEGEKAENEGLCLTCARELGIKPVEDLMNKMGLSDEDVEQVQEQFSELMEAGGDVADENENFMPGGAATFPFLQNVFGSMAGEKSAQGESEAAGSPAEDTPKKGKKSDKKRKFLQLYCTDLTAKAHAGGLDRIVGRDR